MASRQWRERLILALRRQGLPAVYIDRLVEELSDHAADLSLEDASMEAQQNVETRLGAPEQLAAVATAQFQRRSFAGRHPILTFLVGPPIAAVVTLVASMLLMAAGLWLIDTASGGALSANDAEHLPPSALEDAVMCSFNCVVRFAPFVVPTWLFLRLGRRAALRAWPIASCGILTILALLFCSIIFTGDGHSMGCWAMGVAGWRGFRIGIDQWVQAAMPVALAFWMLRQSASSQRRSGRSELALQSP